MFVLTGAPENPISGTLPSNLCLVSVIASKTYPNSLSTSTFEFSLSKSSAFLKGSSNVGPYKGKTK